MTLRESENDLQIAVLGALRYTLRAPEMVFHIPNGGARDARTGATMKRLGVRAGAPDLAILLMGGITLWVELKVSKGKSSQAQLDFGAWALNAGHTYRVCRSVDEVLALVRTARACRKVEKP